MGLASVLAGAEGGNPSTGYGPRSEEERAIAEQIKAEDARDQKAHGDPQLVTLEGKVHLAKAASLDTAPWILGHFSAEKRAYRVLLDEPGLYPELKALNGQRARLSGRLRVGGQYFVVSGIHRPVRVPVGRPKRGGM